MALAMSRVEPDSFITLRYRLAGPQGDVVNTFGRRPATLSMGSDQLSPALEKHLLGLPEGTHKIIELAPNEAFGEHNPDMVQWLARSELDQLNGGGGETYTVGEALQFPTPDGHGQIGAVIRAIAADGSLQLDFNHPLAGQPVTFEIELISVL